MSQDTTLQILMILLVVIAYIINAMSKFNKREVKSIQPPKIPVNRVHVKTAPVKLHKAPSVCGKEDSLLDKNSSSRGKRILKRACLRQSILTSEILGKKY